MPTPSPRPETTREKIKAVLASMDDLRLQVRYLLFDLEATRRENQHLRDLLHKYGIDE